jgi:hypothetical protein
MWTSRRNRDSGRLPQEMLGAEFKKFVEIAEVPRILHRLTNSNTGKDGIRPLQAACNRTYKSKGGINKAMPNDVMWMDTDRGRMGWVNLYDEVAIDRIVTWIKHANSDGVEHKIASAADFRSEGLTKSNSPVLKGGSVRPWDGTMMGRIVEWMSSDIGR